MVNDKKTLRRGARARRDALPIEYRQEASEKMLEILCRLEEYDKAKAIFLFSNIGSEPLTDQWAERFRQDGKATYYPRTSLGGVMDFYRVNGAEALIEGRYGILEPRPDCVLGTPGKGDLILTPGLIFDVKGYRIGYGGGFYDRYKERFPQGMYIGVAYDEQKINDELPRDAFDCPVEMIVTQMGITKF
ncbi:MAG: 5-formyltetrahydrofolate cyclo-ligase [Firmicutes bacterium]|nr:5-formyltetrahydrofolate cyclo-ligase [Bacillota bacterium]